MLRPFPSSMRAAANTPAEPVGACVVRFPTGDSLPRYQGGSASASNLSRPARRSLVLRPAWSLSRPWRPVTSKCFRRCRCLHHPLRLLPAGATVAGRDSHPLKNGALHGAPDNAFYVAFGIVVATPHPQSTPRWRRPAARRAAKIAPCRLEFGPEFALARFVACPSESFPRAGCSTRWGQSEVARRWITEAQRACCCIMAERWRR